MELPSKAPSPNTVTLKIRALMCALVGGGHKEKMQVILEFCLTQEKMEENKARKSKAIELC